MSWEGYWKDISLYFCLSDSLKISATLRESPPPLVLAEREYFRSWLSCVFNERGSSFGFFFVYIIHHWRKMLAEFSLWKVCVRVSASILVYQRACVGDCMPPMTWRWRGINNWLGRKDWESCRKKGRRRRRRKSTGCSLRVHGLLVFTHTTS